VKLAWLRLLPRAVRDPVIRRVVAVDDKALQGITVRLAETIDEYVEAARLVYDGYHARGILDAHEARVRITPFLALPSTLIFVALQEGRIVGTISVVVDGPAGLPMETIYGKEVAALRAQGRRIAEVGALCVTPGLRGFGVPFLLNKAMGLSARDVARVDDLVIAVHPRAHDLYRALLGFETMGPIREYPSLKKSALAVGLRLPLREAQESYRARYGDRVAKANPYYLYFQRRDPQIVFPTDEAGLERVRQVHRRAAVKLLALRPDVLIDLSTDSFGIVSRALGSPGPADDSQR
jgi:hypothetical protein